MGDSTIIIDIILYYYIIHDIQLCFYVGWSLVTVCTVLMPTIAIEV